MKRSNAFKFRCFEVEHSRSSMKVGVDAVLIGAWTDCEGSRILDVGTGCGVIALMAAQRNPDAIVTGIDIDKESCNEASLNFSNSRFASRLEVKPVGFDEIVELCRHNPECRYDLVISNPPYFISGVTEVATPRLRARHCGNLSPAILLKNAGDVLKEGGRLSFISPSEHEESLWVTGEKYGLSLRRICRVAGRRGEVPKRIMMEWINSGDKLSFGEEREETLAIEISPNLFTREYVALTQDYYFKSLPTD